MPQPGGSSPLVPISRVATGVFGLNLQQSNLLLDPHWATQADNLIFSPQGILMSRYGWGSPLNATPITGSPAIRSLFQYTPISGTNQIISAAGNNLYYGTATPTSITGSLTPTADNWKFVNFNGYVYGLQSSHPLIMWNGSGDFTAVTAATGTVPTGNELLSAFGRLWGSDSTGQLLQYSQLLDATNWDTTGAGSFDLTSVWGSGNDAIVALAAFNNFLIVFGSNNIIIWTDGTGSVLGMDPINMYVYDMISGMGCVNRDTVQNSGGSDIVFMAYSGLNSLQRIIIQRSNPARNISINVRDALLGVVVGEQYPKTTYNAVQGQYILACPANQQIFVFDTKQTLPDGSWRVTQWNNFFPQALLTLEDNTTTYAGYNGQIFEYGSADSVTDDNGTNYEASYSSGWFDLGDELNTRLKILKRLTAVVSANAGGTGNLRWQWDFSGQWSNYPITLSSSGDSTFGVSQFGIDGFGGSATGSNIIIPASGNGQYLQIGADFYVEGNTYSLQQMNLYAKVGRVI